MYSTFQQSYILCSEIWPINIFFYFGEEDLFLIKQQRTKYTIIYKRIQEIYISYISYHTIEKETMKKKICVDNNDCRK